MQKPFFLLGVAIATAASAFSDAFAPAAYVAPIPPKSIEAYLDKPISQNDLVRYLRLPARTTELTMFAGQNELLKNREGIDTKLLRVAEGFEVELSGVELFGPPLPEGGVYVHRTIVSSIDALALRLQMDLSQLSADAELYVVDPVLPRAFGPYTAEDQGEAGRWLAITEGEWAMLVIKTPSSAPPPVRLICVAHFYRGFDDFFKQLACNINIACEDNPALLDIASGVGMLVVPGPGGVQGFCTCTLINNADTPEHEPYVLTSNHCVPEVVAASQADVIWDYRATDCGSNDPPPLGSRARSTGVHLLTTNSALDITLMELDHVPNGPFGRFYAGWATRPVTAGEAITGIHHPKATHMRISYGDILRSNVSGMGYSNQIEVLWSDGVTEPGSSGLGLLLNADGYPIIGTLSNGPLHSCAPSAVNTDRFSSFRLFFPQAKDFLTGTQRPEPQDPDLDTCPAEVAFKNHPEVLRQLRTFRDITLAKTPVGRRSTVAYYDMAPGLAAHLRNSPESAAVFRAFARAVVRPHH